MGKLTALKVKSLKNKGYYVDGNCLLLHVQNADKKSWIARIQHNNRRRDYGLGSVDLVSLSEAREKVITIKKLLKEGKDPLLEAQKGKSIPDFKTMASLYYDDIKSGFKNQKDSKRWIASLEKYVFPYIGSLSVNVVEETHIVNLLKPIWHTKHKTAIRILQKIYIIIGIAQTRRYRSHILNSNGIRLSLPKVSSITRHYPSLDYLKIPEFIKKLSIDSDRKGNLALLLATLTTLRIGNVRMAEWSEIDLVNKTWLISAEKMKMNREHVVPLSEQAIEIIKKIELLEDYNPNGYLFNGRKKGTHISEIVTSKSYKDTGFEGVVHGLRSSFKAYMDNETEHPDRLIEMCLAHTNPNQTEAAYSRSQIVERRRKIMQEWSNFCYGILQPSAKT